MFNRNKLIKDDIILRIFRPNITFIVLLFIFFSSTSFSALNNSKTLILDESTEKVMLGKHISYFVDDSGELTINDIVKSEKQNKFIPSNSELPNMGFTSAVYWIKLDYKYTPKVINEKKTWIVDFFYPLVDRVSFYQKDNTGEYRVTNMGDDLPFSFRVIKHTNFLYKMKTTPGVEESLYIRLQTDGAFRISLALWDQEKFLESDHMFQMLFGMAIGAVMVMVLYNLFIYLTVRDTSYLYYVFYSFSFVVLQLSLEGVAYQYLWPNNPWLADFSIILWGGIFGYFLISFVRSLLKTKQNFRYYDKFLILIQAVSILLAISVFFVPYMYSIRFLSIFVVIVSATSFLTGVMGIIKGINSARIYSLACVCFLIGILVYVLMARGFLPYNYFTGHAGLFGAIAEVVFFSFALAAQINSERIEKDKAQAESLEHLKHYQDVFENAAEGLFRCDPKGVFKSVNRSLAEMLGFTSIDHLLSSNYSLENSFFVKNSDQEKYREKVIAETNISSFEVEFYRADKSIGWASCSVRIINDSDGNIESLEGSIVDITVRKEKEAAEKEREKAEASANAKSSFLANMSHEIRTPMNAIIGFSELALKSCKNPVKVRGYLDKINFSSQTLLGIINDILDFSKIEAGKLNLEIVEFNLDDVIGNVSDLFSRQVLDKKLEYIVSVPPEIPRYIKGDSLRLGQVIINLLTNAFKFTEEGEIRLEISVKDYIEKSVTIEFAVIDTGIGIDSKKIPKLFKSFSQADESTTRKYGGTGLGLAICKNLVELMGGRISVESEEGKGSRFSFFANFEMSEEQRSQSEIPKELKGLKVLVVDDNENNLDIIKDMLDSLGLNPITTTSANDALNLLFEDPSIDMMIVDWMMPEMDGIQLIKTIRGDNKHKTLPIVMMTAYGREDVRQKAFEVGVDTLLLKPVRWTVLLDTILDLFDESRECVSDRSSCNDLMDMQILFKGANVLLVEDNAINRDLVTELLADKDVSLSRANNGKEAVAITKDQVFDIILMDIQMPEMNGFEATENIRKDKRYDSIPIIAMTANAMKGVKEKCLKCGMNDFLTKPINVEMFFQVLKKWLDHEEVASSENDNSSSLVSIDNIPKDLPGIDVAKALSAIGNNLSLLIKLANKFIEDYKDATGDLLGCLRQKDFESSARIAHTIKGISGNLGAEPLRKESEELQYILDSYCDSADSNVVIDEKKLLEGFSKELAIVIDSLSLMLKSVSDNLNSDQVNGQDEVLDADTIMKEVLSLLDENNISAASLIDKLISIDNVEDKDLWKKIQGQIRSFDFVSAKESISKLIH